MTATYANEQPPILTIRDALDAGNVLGRGGARTEVPKRAVVPGKQRGEDGVKKQLNSPTMYSMGFFPYVVPEIYFCHFFTEIWIRCTY